MEKLIVNFDRTNSLLGIVACISLTLIFFGIRYLISNHGLLRKIIRLILALFSALYLAGFIQAIILVTQTKPMMVIDEEGMWVDRYGLIPWKDIKDVVVYRHWNGPMEALGIWLKDLTITSRNATISGKMVIMWSRIFDYPNINLAGLDVPNQVIVDRAQYYLKK